MKKLICLVAALATSIAMAAMPTCTVEQEFWGRKYLKLTDVKGVVHKITTMPQPGRIMRFVTKTGWYDIDSDAKIIRFQDPK